MEDQNIARLRNKRIDELEASMVEFMGPVDCPVKHLFCHGMYIREITIPAGSLLTSKIHKTEHPFTLSKGKASVLEDGCWLEISAPHTGITKVGTRRVVLVTEDAVWTTYHRDNKITGQENSLSVEAQEAIVDQIEAKIIQKHQNKLINRRKEIWHG